MSETAVVAPSVVTVTAAAIEVPQYLALDEREVIHSMRLLRQDRKPCMMVLRFDGDSWFMYEAQPPKRLRSR